MASESWRPATAVSFGSSPQAIGTCALSVEANSPKKESSSKTAPAPIEPLKSTRHFVQSASLKEIFPCFSLGFAKRFSKTFCTSGSTDENEGHGNTMRGNKRFVG